MVLTGAVFAAAARGETVFRRSMDRVASMDPADASSIYAGRAVQLVYETLLDFDYRARPYRLVPGLAGLPEVQSNGMAYVLRLAPGARFHPDPCFGLDGEGNPRGRAVVAEDVVFSLKRLGDRRVASPGEWLVLDSIAGMRAFAEASMSGDATDYSRAVEGLEALDARTVRITLTRPMHQFVWFLAMSFTGVVPREAVGLYGEDFGNHAVGSGPYRLEGWRRNHQMTFVRDREWRGWREGPAAWRDGDAAVPFDRIVYSVIDDVSTQWLCFLSGELDFLGEVARDNWDVVIDGTGGLSESLKRRGITLYSMPVMDVAYLGINMDDPVLGANKKLRQALNCAFDSAAWVKFFNHRTVVCDGPLPPGMAGRLETPFPYAHNPAKARALLAEAGYPDGIDPKTGKRLELTLDLGRTSQDVRESTELLVSFFARVGISLKAQYHNWPTFLRRVSNRQSQMFRIGWAGDYPDAENFLQLFYGRNVSPGPNRTNYVNQEFDRLYEAACAAADETERNRIWERAQDVVREDCPWIFLHYQKSYSLTHSRILNYIPSDFSHGSERHLRTPNAAQ
jgi:ABC-type transport system substrate-binding protein